MRLRLVVAATCFTLLAGVGSAQQQAATLDFPAELRGQIEEMYKRSVLAPPMAPPTAPQTTCGNVAVGSEVGWTAPWKRTFSHHPSEWPWMKQYPAGTIFRFCQYTAGVAGTKAEIAYTTEVVTLNPTPAQLVSWMWSACRTAIQLHNRPTDRFDQCLRGLYWGLPMQAPEDRKAKPGIRAVAGGNFVVAGSITQHQSRGGIVCYRDGVAVLRERPGLPRIGYFALTEANDGRLAKDVNDGELAECFKIASPREWPGGSPAQVTSTTRDQFWAALPKLGLSPSPFGLTKRADLNPSETWRRVVREAHLAALKASNNLLVDAWAIANGADLLK